MKPQHLLLCALSSLAIASPQAIAAPQPTIIAQFRGEEQTSIDVYQKASPAVVTLKAGRSEGSGSIISSEGLVLTNEHVVRGSSSGRVTVKTASGQSYTGSVIATDKPNDLALVRLNTSDRFPTLQLANQNGIQIGQRVYAIGSPFGLSGTLTTGILSRIDGDGDLQTDAALNPGNSGGPLLNSRGELIGVNKAIVSSRSVNGNSGIGFATSSVVARNFISQNAGRINGNSGSTTAQRPTPPRRPPVPNYPRPNTPSPSYPRPNQPNSNRPRLGVTVDSENLVILEVEPGSLADDVGLRSGDRLLAVNRTRLRTVDDLLQFLDRRPSAAVLTFSRDRRLARVRVRF